MARQPRNAAPSEEIDNETGEILPIRERQSLAPIANVEFGREAPAGFQVAKYVSVPMLEVPPGQKFVCQMFDKVRVLPPLLNADGTPRPRKIKGPHYASTIKAANGEARLFTWTTVFKSEMEKAYPDESYVGKWFQITRLPVGRGKDYSTYAITELTPTAAS